MSAVLVLKIIFYVIVGYMAYVGLGLLLSPYIGFRSTKGAVSSGPDKNVRVLSLDTNYDAMSYRLCAIEEAKSEIILSTFKINNDKCGRAVMAALYRAAERGVKVRIIVDGLNGDLRMNSCKEFKVLSAHKNVSVRFYNPVNLFTPWRFNYCLHDKYFIIDDRIYIVGGRNVNDLSLSETAKSNYDRDILIYEKEPGEGTSLSKLKGYFEGVWSLRRTKKRYWKMTRKNFQRGTESLKASYSAPRKVNWEEETFEADAAGFMTNPITVGNKKPELFKEICSVMEEGDRVIIETPYIMCDFLMYRRLEQLCRERSVDLMINSPITGNNYFGDIDYLMQRWRVHRTGVTTYEWYGTHSSHGKTVLVGENISIIGSYNFDMRSTYLDTEIMLFVDCPKLSARIRKPLDQIVSESLKITPDGKKTQGENCKTSKLPIPRKIAYCLLGVLDVVFRRMV